MERIEYTPYFQALIDAKKVILSSVVLPLKDLFINHEIEFEHGLDQTRAYFELLGVAPRETISMTA